MPRLWKDGYRSGVESIDAQHQVIFQTIENLMDLAERRASRTEIERFIQFLVLYCQVHFREEEEVFFAAGLPRLDVARQVSEHAAFLQMLADLESRWKQGDEQVLQEAPAVTRRWLQDHILSLDLPMARHALERLPSLGPKPDGPSA